MKWAIKVSNVSKLYKLGLIGSRTIQDDLKSYWYSLRGKKNPFLKIAEENIRDSEGGDYIFALKGIDLEIKKGEVIGIIGKNGSGKSTLLKLLSRVTKPSTGQIEINGRIASLLEVGTGFHPELTGKENIFLNGAILGMTKNEIKKKIHKIIEFSGCQRYIETPIKRYSSGMHVRLAFAVAAFLEPDILIVDEVLAVGDAEFQKRAIGKMKDVSSRSGRTVLFVSHNMSAIKNLCDRAILLDKGKITFIGETDKTVKKYLDTENNFSISKNFSKLSNENIKILDFKVSPLNGNLISINSGILFELDFYCKIPNIILDVTYELKNYEDVVVFHKGVIITNEMNSKIGKYNLKSQISSYFLNAGTYRLKINFGKNQQIVLMAVEQFYKFTVNNNSLGLNNSVLPGITSPELKSKIHFSNEME